MTVTFLQRIRTMFGVGAGTYPPEELRAVWEEIEKYAAFRSSNESVLRQLDSIPWYAPYLISPVPRMVSRSSAHLLFSEPPEVTPEADGDAENLERIVAENELDTELHRAAMISSSEGEVWGRIVVRRDLLDVPIIEYVSRRRVIPHFAGRFCRGATFVTEWQLDSNVVLRLFETYEPGLIAAQAFYGTLNAIGVPVNLESHAETAGTPEVVFTGFDQPLCAFIPNSIDDDPTRGYSDYCGLEDRFLGINRAATIGDTNTELAGRKRALVDGKYVGAGGELSGDDVFVSHEDLRSVDENGPMKILEYSYDASQISLWLDTLIDSTLIFAGAAPQLVGRDTGAAISGTALRLKMIHSTLEASGKGRFFDRGLKRLLRFAAVIDSRPIAEIGFGRQYAKADELPGVQRSELLPRDDLEASQILAGLAGAEAISIEERVAFLHPDWPEDRRTEEIGRIKAEQASDPLRLPV